MIIEEPLLEGFKKAVEKPKKQKSISGFKIKIPIMGIESLTAFSPPFVFFPFQNKNPNNGN